MPVRVLLSLVLIAIAAGGATVLAAQYFGFSLAILGLLGTSGALAIRMWFDRK